MQIIHTFGHSSQRNKCFTISILCLCYSCVAKIPDHLVNKLHNTSKLTNVKCKKASWKTMLPGLQKKKHEQPVLLANTSEKQPFHHTRFPYTWYTNCIVSQNDLCKMKKRAFLKDDAPQITTSRTAHIFGKSSGRTTVSLCVFCSYVIPVLPRNRTM